LLTLAPQAALAEGSRVRVVRDQAVIWRPGFSTVATVVKAGTELDAVSQQGTWYEVLLPSASGKAGATGFIAVNQVELVAGAPPPRRAALGRDARRPTMRPAPVGVGVRAFGELALGIFDAHQSFSALFGQPIGLFAGGGAEVRVNRLFVQASVQQFKRDGERAFVLDGKTFPLGIADTVTITPIAVTVGWRLDGRRAVPYVGAGIGSYHYTETSDNAAPADNVDARFTSYHVLAGAEWHPTKWVSPAVEIQYTHVPSALTGGLADAFGEHNLGGLECRVKLSVGR
jgi:hypothetical protein